MQTIRKSEDGNLVIVKRAAGFAVSVRKQRWTQATSHYFTDSCRGTMAATWDCIGKELSLAQAEALYNAHAA